MNTKRRIGEAGATNLLIIPLVLLFIVLIGVSVFGYSAYTQAQDYKNNVDQKVEVAVDAAKQQVSAQKDKDYAEKEKFPYVTYTGPQAAGNLKIQYPKTWSAYTVAPQGATTSKPLEAWFQPGQVPAINDTSNTFALRVLVQQQSYDTVVKQLAGQQKNGKVTIQPYKSDNVPNVIGVRVDGEVVSKKQGSMIILPFRDKTLQMWTESTDGRADFDNIILKNFTLTP